MWLLIYSNYIIHFNMLYPSIPSLKYIFYTRFTEKSKITKMTESLKGGRGRGKKQS